MNTPVKTIPLALAAAALSSCGGGGISLAAVEITEPFEIGEQASPLWSRQVSSLPADVSAVLAQRGDRLYAVGRDGVSSFDAGSGDLVWKAAIEEVSSGTATDGDLVVVSSRTGAIVALNTDSGERVWTMDLAGEALSPVAIGGNLVVVQTSNGRVFALSAEDGSLQWQQEFNVPALSLHGIASPILLAGQVLVADSSCKAHMYRQSDGTLLWEKVLHLPEGNNELERLVDADAQPVFLRQALYIACHNGQMAMLKPPSGDVIWQKEFSSRHDLLLSGTSLLSIDHASILVAHQAVTGKELWRSEALRYRRLSDPVVWQDRLVVGDMEGYIHLFDLESGEQLGRSRPFNREVRTLLAAGERLYALSVDGRIESFTPAPASAQ